MATNKAQRRLKIKSRSRQSVAGSASRPRLCVFRSNKEIYAQLIDDASGTTIASASSLKNDKIKGNKVEQATAIGKQIAEKAVAAGISDVVFDRNGYLYHGRIKSLADGAREGGLKF